jgi:tetratricopeptide (TPR) repeat protein
VGLPLELKKEVLYTHARLDALDHWSLLGVPWSAPVERVREAYLAKVKVFHPDRHPGNLGSYRARMEAIVRRLTDARDTLVHPTERAAYARKTASPEEVARIEVQALGEEKRSEERRSRLARTNPLLARAGRIQELLARGKRAREEGRWQAALNDFQLVVSLDERNAEARKLADEARRKAGSARAGEEYERGLTAEISGQIRQAISSFLQAAEADPQSTRFALAASRAALTAGDIDLAREQAERALRLAPRDGAAHEALGKVLHAGGNGREAKKALERALELNPDLEQARALLKKMRWSFLG